MGRFNPVRNVAPVLTASRQWADRCLLGDASVLSEAPHLWTLENLDELDRVFVRSPDSGEETFRDKLYRQLQSGSPASRKLMAEAMWILMLFQSNISEEKKRENIRTIWA